MGRSQVKYNRTHGRGRGKQGSGSAESPSEPKGASQQHKNKSQQSSLAGSNAWRYEKRASSSSNLNRADRNNSITDQQQLDAFLQQGDQIPYYGGGAYDYDDDGDDDDISMASASQYAPCNFVSVSQIDGFALAEALKRLRPSVRLGLSSGPTSIYKAIGRRLDKGSRDEKDVKMTVIGMEEERARQAKLAEYHRDAASRIAGGSNTISHEHDEVKVAAGGVSIQQEDDPSNDSTGTNMDDDEDLDAWLDSVIT